MYLAETGFRLILKNRLQIDMAQIEGAVGGVAAPDVQARHLDHPRAITRLQYVMWYDPYFESIFPDSTYRRQMMTVMDNSYLRIDCRELFVRSVQCKLTGAGRDARVDNVIRTLRVVVFQLNRHVRGRMHTPTMDSGGDLVRKMQGNTKRFNYFYWSSKQEVFTTFQSVGVWATGLRWHMRRPLTLTLCSRPNAYIVYTYTAKTTKSVVNLCIFRCTFFSVFWFQMYPSASPDFTL